MTGPDNIAAEAARIDRLLRERATVELDAADALARGAGAVGHAGEAPADVLLVKGAPGPDDRAAGQALAGPDGEAIGRALDALDLPASRCAICSRAGVADAGARSRRLRLAVEAVDPRVIVALDREAADDLAAAFGLDAVASGRPVRVLGRELVAVDDFAGSLGDDAAKRRAWEQLRALRHTR